MAQVAYDFERFAAAPEKAKPPVRLAPRRREAPAKKGQFARMMRVLLPVLVVVALACGVLYTQTSLTELHNQIAAANTRLTEEEALNAHLSFELENMTTMKNVEEKAQEMGMEKMQNSQVTYFRAEDGNSITVRENPFAALWERVTSGLLSIFEGLML